jgi:hypothetical protein
MNGKMLTGRKTQGTKKTGGTPVFLVPRSVGRPRCSRAGCGSGNRIRGDAKAQAGRKAGAGRGTRPEGATAPEGADRYANDKRLRRADAGAASAIGARGASGTSLHQASGVTDAVRCVMPSGTLPVASETVAARARAWCPRGHCSFARKSNRYDTIHSREESISLRPKG